MFQFKAKNDFLFKNLWSIRILILRFTTRYVHDTAVPTIILQLKGQACLLERREEIVTYTETWGTYLVIKLCGSPSVYPELHFARPLPETKNNLIRFCRAFSFSERVRTFPRLRFQRIRGIEAPLVVPRHSTGGFRRYRNSVPDISSS